MKLRFSIVTVTYNAAAVLQRTLDSVLMQDYQYVEHLILDGASTDGTLQLAEQYKEKSDETASSHEVIVRSEPDRGIYDAMNKGLQQATGDFVVFLNAGDSLPSGTTLSLLAERATEQSAVLYGDTAITDSDGNYLYPRRHRPPRRLTWRSFKKGMLVCHQAFYVRTELARQLPYDLRYRYSADVDWCIRVMKEAARQGLELTNVGAVIANYTEEGQTTLHHRESLRERYEVMCSHYGRVQTFLLHCWFVVRAVIKR